MTTQITYELEKDDILAFQRYALKTSPTMKKTRRFFWLLMALLSLYFTLGSESLLETAIRFVMDFGVWMLIFLCTTWALNEYVFRRSVPSGENNGVTGRHQLILTEDEVIERTSVNEGHHHWKGVHRIEEDARYIYLYVTLQNAHVVPKRAFMDAGQAQQFLQTAKALHVRATQGGAVEPARPVELKAATPCGDAMPVAYFDERARSPIERVFSE